MFIAIISPPLIPIARILDVVFPPAPPTPMTLIRAACFFKISSSSLSISECGLCCGIDCAGCESCISPLCRISSISGFRNLGL